jgi:hypothetical protein
MDDLLMSKFNHEVVMIDRNLKELEAYSGPITGYEVIKSWNIVKIKLSQLCAKLHSFALEMEIFEKVAPTLYALQQRLEQLPYTPNIRDVTRAQNLLALSPHIVVTEDMKPDEQELPELKRVTVMKSDGTVLFDQDFLPQRVQEASLPSWDTPTESTLQATVSIPLAQIWEDLTKALSGQYILADDLALVQLQLEVTAERFQLPSPVLIGESILDLYIAYFGTNIISTLGDPTNMPAISATIYEQTTTQFLWEASHTTIERAQRIMRILQEIASCTLTASSQFN